MSIQNSHASYNTKYHKISKYQNQTYQQIYDQSTQMIVGILPTEVLVLAGLDPKFDLKITEVK